VIRGSLDDDDMMRNTVIVASFVLHTVNRDEKLPRKPEGSAANIRWQNLPR
jgi:hypothetical protein